MAEMFPLMNRRHSRGRRGLSHGPRRAVQRLSSRTSPVSWIGGAAPGTRSSCSARTSRSPPGFWRGSRRHPRRGRGLRHRPLHRADGPALPEEHVRRLRLSEDGIAEARAPRRGPRQRVVRRAGRRERLEAPAPFDLITAFDAIHDQADPAGVLAPGSGGAGAGGTFVMLDVWASSEARRQPRRPDGAVPLHDEHRCTHERVARRPEAPASAPRGATRSRWRCCARPASPMSSCSSESTRRTRSTSPRGAETAMSERFFGARVRRREDPRLVTGRGRYVADVALSGLLHVAVHRSPHAHARIVRIDAAEARGAARRRSTFWFPPTSPRWAGCRCSCRTRASIAPACPEILPQEIVSYAGQPVALVVAESAAQAGRRARRAPRRVRAAAARGLARRRLRVPTGPRVHPGGNVAVALHPARGRSGRRARPRRRRCCASASSFIAAPAWPWRRAIAARWDAELGQVTVWSTHAGAADPAPAARALPRLPEHAVRVVTQDIGGGFGPKAIVYAEDILVPFLARALGRPVALRRDAARAPRWRSRRSATSGTTSSWGSRARAGSSRVRDTFVHDCGAFVSWGVIVPILTSVSVPGPYRVPQLRGDVDRASTPTACRSPRCAAPGGRRRCS